MEKDKLSALLILFFWFTNRDGVISTEYAYHIQNKKTKSIGLIEELQIKAGSLRYKHRL
jgi:hypothetical protein